MRLMLIETDLGDLIQEYLAEAGSDWQGRHVAPVSASMAASHRLSPRLLARIFDWFDGW